MIEQRIDLDDLKGPHSAMGGVHFESEMGLSIGRAAADECAGAGCLGDLVDERADVRGHRDGFAALVRVGATKATQYTIV